MSYGGDLSAEEIVTACRNVGIDLNCGGCAAAFYAGHAEPHDEGCTSTVLSAAAAEGTLHMAVARLGGTVEGCPTHRINFLQRIDELRAIENNRDLFAAEMIGRLGLDRRGYRPPGCAGGQ